MLSLPMLRNKTRFRPDRLAVPCCLCLDLTDFAALTDRVPLASIDCYLTVAEVYEKLEVGGAP